MYAKNCDAELYFFLLTASDGYYQVVPYISGEEDKLETEYKKILGSVSSTTGANRFVPLEFPLTAHANRYVARSSLAVAYSLSCVGFQRHGSRWP